MPIDYASITELPGSHLSPEQFLRMLHRYGLAAQMAKDRRVLEVAVGAGVGLGLLQEHAEQVVAVDYSASVLETAQAHYQDRVLFVRADAQHLPLPSHSFDLILCFEAIYYLPDYTRFLAECRRLLAPGGTLFLSTSNPDWPNFVAGSFTTHYPTVPELAAALTQAGFRAIEVHGILPATQHSALDRLRNRARSLLMQHDLIAQTIQRLAPLKKLAYRDLIHLPAELKETERAAQVALASLPPHRRDHNHRVLYYQSKVSGWLGGPTLWWLSEWLSGLLFDCALLLA